MSFKMLDDLTILGRRGDSANFSFKFDEDISAYDFVFQIKKNVNDKDSNAIIRKIYRKPETNTITVELTKDDTLKLSTTNNGYSSFRWGLKAFVGENFSQTLIPRDNFPAPKLSILPAIVEGLGEND